MNMDIINFIQDILPISVSLFIMAVFFAFLFVKTPSSYKLKFFGIPLLLFSTLVSVYSMEGILGKSFYGTPPEHFMLIDYRTAAVKDGKRIIEAWLYLPNNTTRLYKFPFSKKLNQTFENAKKKMDQGIPLIGNMIDNVVEFAPIDPSELLPKDKE